MRKNGSVLSLYWIDSKVSPLADVTEYFAGDLLFFCLSQEQGNHG
jgi:hypothetical protein